MDITIQKGYTLMQPKLINKIYLAGPLEGRTAKERFAWRDYATDYLKDYGIETYIPGEDLTLNDAHSITILDYAMIDNSEALLVNLTCLGENTPTNTGTLIEIGYAKKAGKLIIAYTNSEWQRENRFLKGTVDMIFNKSFFNGDPLQSALDYIASFNKRRRNESEV